MNKRVQQVNQLIQKELSRIILKEVEFPKEVLATVTRVETSSNLIESKIYISTMPAEKTPKVLQILYGQIYELQQKLNQRLQMRPIPKINFIEEKETLEAGNVEEILEKLRTSEE